MLSRMKTKELCAVCAIMAPLKCSDCCALHYCSRCHQKTDWKIPSETPNCPPLCILYAVEWDPQIGHYRPVASRDIQPFKSILEEVPWIGEPAMAEGSVVCVGYSYDLNGIIVLAPNLVSKDEISQEVTYAIFEVTFTDLEAIVGRIVGNHKIEMITGVKQQSSLVQRARNPNPMEPSNNGGRGRRLGSSRCFSECSVEGQGLQQQHHQQARPKHQAQSQLPLSSGVSIGINGGATVIPVTSYCRISGPPLCIRNVTVGTVPPILNQNQPTMPGCSIVVARSVGQPHQQSTSIPASRGLQQHYSATTLSRLLKQQQLPPSAIVSYCSTYSDQQPSGGIERSSSSIPPPVSTSGFYVSLLPATSRTPLSASSSSFVGGVSVYPKYGPPAEFTPVAQYSAATPPFGLTLSSNPIRVTVSHSSSSTGRRATISQAQVVTTPATGAPAYSRQPDYPPNEPPAYHYAAAYHHFSQQQQHSPIAPAEPARQQPNTPVRDDMDRGVDPSNMAALHHPQLLSRELPTPPPAHQHSPDQQPAVLSRVVAPSQMTQHHQHQLLMYQQHIRAQQLELARMGGTSYSPPPPPHGHKAWGERDRVAIQSGSPALPSSIPLHLRNLAAGGEHRATELSLQASAAVLFSSAGGYKQTQQYRANYRPGSGSSGYPTSATGHLLAPPSPSYNHHRSYDSEEPTSCHPSPPPGHYGEGGGPGSIHPIPSCKAHNFNPTALVRPPALRTLAHASQVPLQGDSLVTLLQPFPIMWQGLMALKNDHPFVQMFFISGNPLVYVTLITVTVSSSSLSMGGRATNSLAQIVTTPAMRFLAYTRRPAYPSCESPAHNAAAYHRHGQQHHQSPNVALNEEVNQFPVNHHSSSANTSRIDSEASDVTSYELVDVRALLLYLPTRTAFNFTWSIKIMAWSSPSFSFSLIFMMESKTGSGDTFPAVVAVSETALLFIMEAASFPELEEPGKVLSNWHSFTYRSARAFSTEESSFARATLDWPIADPQVDRLAQPFVAEESFRVADIVDPLGELLDMEGGGIVRRCFAGLLKIDELNEPEEAIPDTQGDETALSCSVKTSSTEVAEFDELGTGFSVMEHGNSARYSVPKESSFKVVELSESPTQDGIAARRSVSKKSSLETTELCKPDSWFSDTQGRISSGKSLSEEAELVAGRSSFNEAEKESKKPSIVFSYNQLGWSASSFILVESSSAEAALIELETVFLFPISAIPSISEESSMGEAAFVELAIVLSVSISARLSISALSSFGRAELLELDIVFSVMVSARPSIVAEPSFDETVLNGLGKGSTYSQYGRSATLSLSHGSSFEVVELDDPDAVFSAMQDGRAAKTFSAGEGSTALVAPNLRFRFPDVKEDRWKPAWMKAGWISVPTDSL